MPFKASSAWEHSKKLTVFPADLEPYYGDILAQYESAYNTAEEAKSRGLDPNEIVESKTVFDLADRVTVMKNGQVVGTAKTTDVSKDEVLGMIILGKCPPGATPGPGAMAVN